MPSRFALKDRACIPVNEGDLPSSPPEMQAMGTEAPTTRRYTGPLRPQEGPLPEVRQTGPTETDRDPDGPHRRLQGRRLPGDHLRRVRRPLRLLHHLPQHPRGRPPQGPLRQQGPRPGARSHPQGRHEHRTDPGVAPARVPPRPLLGVRLRRAPRPGRATRPGRRIAARSWSTSAARSASTNCTWAASPCCWPPTRSRDLPVAFALVAANDQDHMRRFLQNLKTWGLSPGSWSPTARTCTPACWPNCGPTRTISCASSTSSRTSTS